jgi:arylsulfatase A-like enzyme
LLIAPAVGAQQAPKPNVVLIMADDLGYGDLGCYGSTLNRTPHIDSLADAGLRFTDFHSSGPMCTATRVGLLTGRYQQRFGPQFDGAISGTANTPGEGLPLAALTLAEVLKAQGYATGMFGKWHLGYAPPLTPANQGFDEFRGLLSGDGDFHTRVDRSGNPDWWHNDALVAEEGYTTDLITRHSVDFIERHKDRPFFLYVPHLAIHFPWQGPKDPPHREAGTDYTDDKWGIVPDRANVQPHLKAMTESMDDSVGEILAALKKHGLVENTLVIFTSDNGGYLTYGEDFKNISSNSPLRGQKTQLYEGGHRVPMIAAWAGKIRPGVTNETGHSTDFFPTIGKLAGATVADLELDGVDLAPLWFESKPLPERMLFMRKDEDGAVRSGPWKLNVIGGTVELFNLDSDIGESRNLATEMPEKVAVLHEAWETWNVEVDESAKASQ